jgi:hypothetical protein
MAFLFNSSDLAAANKGHFYRFNESTLVNTELTLPDKVKGINRVGDTLSYRRRQFFVGHYSRPLIYTEFRKLHPVGITAPITAPTLALGSDSGGSTGGCIGYLAYGHMEGDLLIAESNLTTGSGILNVTGQGRVWTGIPATSFESRVNKVFGYLSVDGTVPALCWTRDLGVTSVTENVQTGALGRFAANRNDINGQLKFDPNGRCVPPYCKFAEVYHQCMFYAGDPLHPDRIYPSRRFEPEAVNTQDLDGYLQTIDGEAVTGIRRFQDQLIVGCNNPPAFYLIQGFGPGGSQGDWQISKLSSFYGLISGAAMIRCGPNEDLFFPDISGPCIYNGQFRYIIKENRAFWRDSYAANQANFEASYAVEDFFNRAYVLSMIDTDGSTLKWVAQYEPMEFGQQPWWWFFRRTRADTYSKNLIGRGSKRRLLFTGSADSSIRQENVATDANDNGDTYNKAMDLVFGHNFFGDQGGDEAHGRAYTDLYLHLQNEGQAATVSLYGGDDTAFQALKAQDTITIPAGAVTSPRGMVPRTSVHIPEPQVNGKGLTVRIQVTAPVGVEVRGYDVDWREGVQERPFTS